MTVLLLSLLVGGARAEPGDGLPALARSFFVEGSRRQQNGDWRGAALRFEKVVEMEPSYTPAWCRLGDVLAEDGRTDAARRAWEGGAFDPDCVESLGRAELDLALYDDALGHFETLSRLTSADPRVELLIGRALVGREDVDGAVAALDRFLARGTEPSDDLPELVEAIAAQLGDEPERALGVVDRAIEAQPELSERLQAVRDAFVVEVRAIEMMGAAPVSLDADQRRALEDARKAFGAGDTDRALALLEGLVDRATRNPDVWAALADVREATGDVTGAEYALLVAKTLAPQRPEIHARIGQLLAVHFGGRYDREALAAFERALEGNPDADLEWCRAELARRVGSFEVMRRALEAHEALRGDGRTARELCALPTDAAVLRADLDRPRAIPPVVPAVDPPEGVDPTAWLAVHRAQVHLDNDDDARALEEVGAALALEPELVKALNLQGHLLTKAGDHAGAVAVYEKSLAVEPDQGNVMAALSELLRTLGRDAEAREMRDRAAAARSPVARYLLAREAFDANRWWEARDRLDGYFEVASSGAIHGEATALRDEIDRRIRWFWAAVVVGSGALLATVVVLPTAVLLRRRAGHPLSALLARSPRAFREVARIVSAIRHEVLKHNVSALPGVADALEDGDPGPAIWAAERLFGKGGAVARFRRYVEELEELGRAHQVTLNLRHRDPVFAPLLAAMDRLQGLEKRLAAGTAKPAEVRAVSDALNQEGFRALGQLLDGVCVVRLTPGVFEEALEGVLSEPAFRTTPRPDWVLDGPEGLAVRIFRGDLHDILVNLLRNALEASIEAGADRLGVRLGLEEDDITGLERVEIRVCDDAPRRISTAMIRGRYIERGLGLAVDLTSRAGGSIHVEDEPGFSKAVVVRLPLSEGGST
ncbi:MAG: tetratricopeptide repeat protein [Alphaproteobacteria bacterium]|nr:tetratricopeptide repeat protein [Alphaproteobacteria bacterium]